MTFFQWSEADRPLVRSYLVGETSELMLWYAQLTGKPWLRGPFPCTPNIVDIERTYEEAFSQWRRLVSRGREQRGSSSAAAEAASAGRDDAASDASEDDDPGAEMDAGEAAVNAQLTGASNAEELAEAQIERMIASWEDPSIGIA